MICILKSIHNIYTNIKTRFNITSSIYNITVDNTLVNIRMLYLLQDVLTKVIVQIDHMCYMIHIINLVAQEILNYLKAIENKKDAIFINANTDEIFVVCIAGVFFCTR